VLLYEEHRGKRGNADFLKFFQFVLLEWIPLFLSLTAQVTSLTNPNIFTLYTPLHTTYEWLLFLGNYVWYNNTCLNCFIWFSCNVNITCLHCVSHSVSWSSLSIHSKNTKFILMSSLLVPKIIFFWSWHHISANGAGNSIMPYTTKINVFLFSLKHTSLFI
jgi:hypothetical protein